MCCFCFRLEKINETLANQRRNGDVELAHPAISSGNSYKYNTAPALQSKIKSFREIIKENRKTYDIVQKIR